MLEKMREKIALLENHEQIVSLSNRLFLFNQNVFFADASARLTGQSISFGDV